MTSAGKKVFSLAIAALLGTAACGLWGIGQNTSAVFASEMEQVAPTESTTDSESGIMSASACTPTKPEVLLQLNKDIDDNLKNKGITSTYYETHNCFVAYPIKNLD